ncbi:MAG TPA: carbohydrate ABC transporter permease [Ktedonobacteraceae bacterium]|jgi:multiple sugar transport system permease protein|nr:carbohydrate ABC transporter permease [Ktedonobacteraceae bacterium]
MATQSIPYENTPPPARTTTPVRGKAGKGIIYVILTIVGILWIIPMLWAIDTAFKPESQTTTVPVSWIPTHFTFKAFSEVIQAGDLPRWYFNSIVTTVLITVLVVLLASMAAFAFSRIEFRGRGIIFWIMLAGIMVPAPILIIPLFAEMQSFGMIDSYWAIILPQIASPIAVFIFKQFFDGLPHELEEAALMDGASPWRIYWQIWLPLSRPAIAAVAVFIFVAAWNNFVWPFIAVTSTWNMTLPVGLATVQTSYGVHYAQIMASAVLGGLPTLIAFLFFQRQIVQGFAGSGLKD